MAGQVAGDDDRSAITRQQRAGPSLLPSTTPRYRRSPDCASGKASATAAISAVLETSTTDSIPQSVAPTELTRRTREALQNPFNTSLSATWTALLVRVYDPFRSMMPSRQARAAAEARSPTSSFERV